MGTTRTATMLVAILLVVTAACSSGSDPSGSQLTIDRQSEGRDDVGGDGAVQEMDREPLE